MRLAYLSDIHFGDEQDLRAYRFAVALLPSLNVDTVFLGGDIFDQGAVSSWGKAPEQELRLQQELDSGFQELSFLRKKMPDADLHFLPGNHESRLVRYLRSRAKPLLQLRVLGYESLYRLPELDIEFHEEGQPVKFGHLWIAHGHEFPSGGQNPAKTALNAVNSNVLFGHVHKFSIATKTELGGRGLGAWSNACLASLTPNFRLAPDWAQGFTVVDFSPSGYFSITQILFWRDEGRLGTLVNGKVRRERNAQ